MVVPTFAPNVIGIPKLIVEDKGKPLATKPAIDIMVVAITALLLCTKEVASIPIAKPVKGANLVSIIDRR